MLRIISLLILTPFIADSQSFSFAKRVGGLQFDNAMGVAVDSSNHILICGYFSGTADFDPSSATHNLTSAGGNDIFLARYDSVGNYLWAISIGGQGEELIYSDPAVDEFGNIYICGVFDGGANFNPQGTPYTLSNRGGSDGFIAKYDSTGMLVWARGLGGQGQDIIYRVDYKNYLILFAGAYADTAFLDNGLTQTALNGRGQSDVVFGKFLPGGNLFWTSQIGGKGDDYSYNVTADTNGVTYVCGTFNDTLIIGATDTLFASGTTAFIASYSNLGNYIRSFSLTGCIPFGLCVDHNNDLLTCGMFSGFTDFDPGPDTTVLFSQGSFDIYFAKYSDAGIFKFAKRIGGSGMDVGYAIREMKDSNIILTGYFSNTADFDPSVTVASLTSSGLADLFVARYDSLGNYIHAFKCGGSGFDFARNMIVDRNNAVFIVGGFEQTVDFNPAPQVYTLTAAGSRDGYFAKYSYSVSSVAPTPVSAMDDFIFPNPFTNLLNIHLSHPERDNTLHILDMEGKVLIETTCIGRYCTLNAETLPEGVYLLQITDRNNISHFHKLIKLK